jgi:hypothetical protein
VRWSIRENGGRLASPPRPDELLDERVEAIDRLDPFATERQS